MIYEGTEWLTAHQVASRAGVAVGSVRRWKAQRKLFSIWLAGRSVYPAYAFDRVRQWRPLAVVAEVLSAAPEWAPGYTAAFFESTSSFLGGRRPREILSLDPRRAIAAAKFALDTERHPG
ncbi:hypothetical protein [Ramlibacter sp. WS9]|uniref:hypothetical protein n=1 Tax=Ramlibacter sp. WS9 TaxID=1882741 RepID=UPI0011441711|nr:hypothetical protein [Ramlibacter sp. WS9]